MLHFGTRGSALALWQTQHVMARLMAALPGLEAEHTVVTTRGDVLLDTPLPLLGGKGAFTAELEAALRDGRIDGAVHSLKDLPTEAPAGLVIGAILERANPADVLISRDGYSLTTLPEGARVGTGSQRRAAQLLRQRPDLKLVDIRGNVDSRIRKALADEGDYDAIVLAYAGLERLGRGDVASQVLDLDVMLPAPGQGAIAVQTRDDPALVELFRRLHHPDTAIAVTAERAFLAGLGGGCLTSVAAYARQENGILTLRGRVCSPDGKAQIEVRSATPVTDEPGAYGMGIALAHDALRQGADALLARHV